MKYLILKTVNADMTAYNGFVWPKSGYVVAHDWNPEPKCGGGLHGALNGVGDGKLFKWESDAVWIVFEAQEYVDLDGKVKAPSGNVVYCGARLGACEYLQAHGCNGPIIGGEATAGNNGKATAGDYGEATAGDNGKATAGDYGEAIAGYNGKATAGYNGKATAGYYGKATAGCYSEAIAGDYGEATAGDRGEATAGDKGIIVINYYGSRKRIKVGYIGEDGLKPNVAYMLNNKHEFVEA